MPLVVIVICFLVAWVGHAYLWTTLLNFVYARPYPKALLKPWRLVTGLIVLGFPVLIGSAFDTHVYHPDWEPFPGRWGRIVFGYLVACFGLGAVVYPAVNLYRLLRRPPAVLLAATTRTLDVWRELGRQVVGDGKGQRAVRLPGNCVFKVDFTDLTLAIPTLPAAWDGLTILLLSDIHFHGTPSRAFYERVLGEIEARWPTPDLVCLAGDYVDTDEHHTWIGPLLGRLAAREAKLAVLGNHDLNHKPDRVRAELAAAGYRVLGNGWAEFAVRGERCVVVGHEGPWFGPPTDLSAAPVGPFRLCISHTPDQFFWGQRNGVGLMLCGHVHGGQIRLPGITSMFVPSVYGRRFDMGVFEGGGTVMVVGRGLSGKEPLRFRCHPQVIRLTLTPAGTG